MTVREICKAHGVTTLDQQDELLVRLAHENERLVKTIRELQQTVDAVSFLMGHAIRPEASR